MKMMKLIMVTALATSFLIGVLIESADAQRVRKRKYSTDSNQAKTLSFNLNSTIPGIIENISLINNDSEDLIEEGTSPGQIFIKDNQATVRVVSVQEQDIFDFGEQSFSKLITYDVDNLDFLGSDGELSLYVLVPTGSEQNYKPSESDISGLLDLPRSETLYLSAVFAFSSDTPDVFNLGSTDELELTISNLSDVFDIERIEPVGNPFNGFNVTVKETIPEHSTTYSLLALGAVGIGLQKKRRIR